MAPIPAHRTHASAEKVRTEPYRDPELPELGRIHAMVSAVREDGVIYIRTQQAEVQLELLKERIQRTIKTLPKQRPYTWKCVVGCALMGPDMLWYRGEVLNALEGQLKLRYVDSGFVENIPVVHVYPMLLCEEVPRLCFPCVLHRVTPVGKRWQRDAVALLKELLLGRSVDVEVMELPADPQGAPAVRVFVDGLNLSAILYHHQHTSTPEDTLTLPRPFLDVWDMDTEGLGGPQEPVLGPFSHARLPREAKFEVKVKHLCTPNTVFLCPLEGGAEVEVDGETLDEALTRITADVERLAPLSHFPRGGACLARYSDGNYYRARLAELVGLDPVTALVRHVDFGSEDTPPVSTLRQMPPELLHFPARALRVRVAGFRAPSAGPGGDALPYCPEWSVRAAMCMLELLHGHVTASVVAWEPEPTVLLYDGEGAALHLPLLGAGLAEEDHAQRAPPTAGVEL